MKKIKPIKFWNEQATKFSLIATDNLEFSASFYFSLLSEDNKSLSNGSIIMEGKDYEDWLQNQYAWDWAATKLNLELIPD